MRTTLGINLAQGYGLTETVGGVTLSTAEDLSVGRVGQPLPGVRIKLRDWEEGGYVVLNTTGHGPRGEILVGGPMITSGYYGLPEKSAEVLYIDPSDGLRWFRTGDIGQLDPNDGVLKIIDRKKDLVKLQMGEYVSLSKVETWLKTHDFVDSICVIAEPTKSYCVALMVPDSEKLNRFAAQSLDICLSSFTDVCLHPDVIASVTQQLQEYAKAHLEKFEIPRRLALLSEPWTPETGLVTAALKLRRKIIHKKFRWLINELYNDDKYPSDEHNCLTEPPTPKVKNA